MSRDILNKSPPRADKRVHYGTSPQNIIDFRFPEGKGPFPVLLAIHGGFWLSTYDLTHMSHLCAAFTSKGLITCNLEYRRIGDPGGAWPGTFQDISQALDYIVDEMSTDPRFELDRSVALGFSAGGHLALWLAGRDKVRDSSISTSRHKRSLQGVISLAGVSDLRAAWKLRVGNGVVRTFLGGTPEEVPKRYDAGSPIELLPTGVKQVLIHGTADENVPFSQSEGFVERAEKAGDKPLLVKLEGAGHFELIDPESSVWPRIAQAVMHSLGSK